MTTERRQTILTEADLKALADLLKCNKTSCTFTAEEVQFVRDWLDTAKTAKSEFIRWTVKMFVWLIGIACGLSVVVKYGWLKNGGH